MSLSARLAPHARGQGGKWTAIQVQRLGLLQSMPRDGALTLSDVRGPTLSIVCALCGRRGRYSVAKLMEEHGDAKLTDLLQTLADCQKARSASIHDRCKAVYEGL
jgi:hypothetical protein